MELVLTGEKVMGRTGILVLAIFMVSTVQFCHSLPVCKNVNGTSAPCSPDSAFHNETSCCYKIYDQGPCGDLQVFYRASQGSQYGTCACMTNDGCRKTVDSNRMILLSPDKKKCFWAYSQGPCARSQWYVLNLKTLKPECQTNPCSSSSPSQQPADPLVDADVVILGIGPGGNDKFTFVENNTCYKSYTQAYCQDGEYVQFDGTNNPFPKCYLVTRGLPPKMCLMDLGPTAGMPCEAGFKLVGDNCVMANIEFE